MSEIKGGVAIGGSVDVVRGRTSVSLLKKRTMSQIQQFPHSRHKHCAYIGILWSI
jgi:hypothetical protein